MSRAWTLTTLRLRLESNCKNNWILLHSYVSLNNLVILCYVTSFLIKQLFVWFVSSVNCTLCAFCARRFRPAQDYFRHCSRERCSLKRPKASYGIAQVYDLNRKCEIRTSNDCPVDAGGWYHDLEAKCGYFLSFSGQSVRTQSSQSVWMHERCIDKLQIWDPERFEAWMVRVWRRILFYFQRLRRLCLLTIFSVFLMKVVATLQSCPRNAGHVRLVQEPPLEINSFWSISIHWYHL